MWSTWAPLISILPGNIAGEGMPISPKLAPCPQMGHMHGCRSQRLIETGLFWIAAREAPRTFGQAMPWQGILFTITYKIAAVLELAGLAMILAVPRLGLPWHSFHEPIKVIVFPEVL